MEGELVQGGVGDSRDSGWCDQGIVVASSFHSSFYSLRLKILCFYPTIFLLQLSLPTRTRTLFTLLASSVSSIILPQSTKVLRRLWLCGNAVQAKREMGRKYLGIGVRCSGLETDVEVQTKPGPVKTVNATGGTQDAATRI